MGFFELFSGALGALYAVVQNYGIAIILLTVLVRLILLPLSIKQVRSMREMQRIQPEMKRLQQKYKGDRQKLNEEMMKLYKEHGVNPFGGCLPLLSQIVVLIPLFQVLRFPLKYMGFGNSAAEGAAPEWVARNVDGLLQTIQQSSLAEGLERNAAALNNFLGIHLDCSAASTLSGRVDPTIASDCGSGIVTALPYLLLVLIMGATTYVQQKQMQVTRAPGDSSAAQMQMIGKIMPIMLMVFSYAFPAGLVLYWLTTNVWMIGQQRLMFKAAPALPPAGAKADGKVKGGGPKQGGKAAAKPAAGKPPTKKKTTAASSASETKTTTTPSKPHPSSKKKKRR